MEPLIRNCENCRHFDGDAFCTLPASEQLIGGHIKEAELVVCAKHDVREDPHEAYRKAEAAEGIAYENALYRLGGRY